MGQSQLGSHGDSGDTNILTFSKIADIIYDVNEYDDGYKHARLLSLVRYMNKTLGFTIRLRRNDGHIRSDREIARDIQDMALANVESKLMFTGKSDEDQRKIVENLVKMVNRNFGSNILLKYTDFNGTHQRSIEELSDDLYMVFDKVRNKLKVNRGLVHSRITKLNEQLKKRLVSFNRRMNDTFLNSSNTRGQIVEKRGLLKKLSELINNVQKKMIDETQIAVRGLRDAHEGRMDKVIAAFPGYSSFSTSLGRISDPMRRKQKKLEIVVKALLSMTTNNIRCTECYARLQVNIGGFASMSKINKLNYIKSRYDDLMSDADDELKAKLLLCFNTIIRDIENDLQSCSASTDPMIVNTMDSLTVSNFANLTSVDKNSIRQFIINSIISKYTPGNVATPSITRNIPMIRRHNYSSVWN